MSIEYLGLSSINGPLIALEGVQDAFFDEIVEFVVDGTQRKIGSIVEIYEDKTVKIYYKFKLGENNEVDC